jgi:hypothetical protein
MMKMLWWSAVLAGIGAVTLAAEPTASAAEPAFRFSKKLDVPALNQEELIALPLESDVFAATRAGLPDIRILEDGGNEMSFLLRKATTTKSETTRDYWPAREPAVKPLDDGGLETIVHLGKDDQQPDGIRLITPLRNFEQRIRVFSSTDGKDWQPVSDEAVIFDYSQYMDVRSDSIPIRADEHRYFRIVIDKVTQELESQLKELTRRLRGDEETGRSEKIVIERRPFRIDRVEFWREVAHEQVTGERKVSYPLAGFRVTSDPDKQQTTVSVESRREPLTALKLVTTSHNFSRRAQVQIEETHGIQKTWRTIGEATVSRLDFRNLKREELAISFRESREIAYRIVIDNQNSPPLDMTGVEATGNVYELLFLAVPPEKQYRLAYGSEDATAASYDTAAIDASLAAGYQPMEAGLGVQVEVAAGGQPTAFTLSRLMNDARVLGGAVVALVAALGWGLYRAGRRLNDLPQDPADS